MTPVPDARMEAGVICWVRAYVAGTASPKKPELRAMMTADDVLRDATVPA
jgi:hypothetical protein